MVKYVYDAWGNHAVLDANGEDVEDSTHIGNLNPFRYRGYYFDTETGLYFLQTRYYDPETGRFISQDSVEFADPETINGLNLYAYCGNNPVNYVDPTGECVVALGLGLVAAGFLLLVWIEATFHPIQNFVEYIFNAIENLTEEITINTSTENGSSSSNSNIDTILNIEDNLLPIGTDILQLPWGNNIVLDVYNPDPFKRPGQHKQGSERKNKSRKKPGWIDKSGKRRPKPPKKHTPGRDHRHHQSIILILELLLNIIY